MLTYEQALRFEGKIVEIDLKMWDGLHTVFCEIKSVLLRDRNYVIFCDKGRYYGHLILNIREHIMLTKVNKLRGHCVKVSFEKDGVEITRMTSIRCLGAVKNHDTVVLFDPLTLSGEKFECDLKFLPTYKILEIEDLGLIWSELHPSILKVQDSLAEKGLVVPIEKRDSNDSWSYDGNSIAQYQNGLPLKPAILLHEICHWVVAEPWQRNLPEYGLQVARINRNAWGGEKDGYRNEKGEPLRELRDNNHLVSRFEQTVQEFITQMLCMVLGEKFNIPLEDSYEGLEYMEYWEEYYEWKLTEEWTIPDNPNHSNLYLRENISSYRTALPRFHQLIWNLDYRK